MDEQIRSLIDVVHQTICDNEEEFLRAEGMAVLTVAKQGDRPRITLDSRKALVGVLASARPERPSRLAGEVRQLADDVRRAMIADEVLVTSAREIAMTIGLRGARPSFELGYKGQRA